MTNYERLILDASKAWVPEISKDFPWRSSTAETFQTPVESRFRLVTNLKSAIDAKKPAYISTYSFPRGHTDDGENIPEIDTIFVDFDIPRDSEYRDGDSRTLNEWKRSMSELLIRVQMVADTLLESGKAKHWRASLSGHKGVHLFFDFDPIHPGNGSYSQFRNGLGEYGEGMIDQLDEISGGINIGPWVDVDSSDLARLVRHPNTRHPDAKHTDESWCVPVTIEELSDLTPEKYLELTSGPREVPESCQRVPSSEATDEIALKIRSAGGRTSSGPSTPSVKDYSRIEEYQEKANDRINVSDIPFLVSDKPCIMAFVERDDSYNYGHQSRVMEIQVMKELIQKSVPIEVITNFFSPIDGWDSGSTEALVKDLISRYSGPFVCTNVWEDAPEFCVAMDDQKCGIYDRVHDSK